MTPRTGRPTDDPKTEMVRFRASEVTMDKLEYCHQATGRPKSEIIREGIDIVYTRLKDAERKE